MATNYYDGHYENDKSESQSFKIIAVITAAIVAEIELTDTIFVKR